MQIYNKDNLSVYRWQVNPFVENTYLIVIAQNAILVDPGFYTEQEKQVLSEFVDKENIAITDVWLTHGHIDHILGLAFVKKQYNPKISSHQKTQDWVENANKVAAMYGMPIETPPAIDSIIETGEQTVFENQKVNILYTPGHSEDHLAFYFKDHAFILSGDVLFKSGIGRTDLPGGNTETLLATIKNELFILPESCQVYSGHGEITTIGEEKQTNPFFN